VAPAAPAAGPARLEVEGGETVALAGEVTIGRGTDQRIRVADSRASRAHAVVRPRARGGWELADVGSANGTTLNGHRVPDGRVAPLRDGDRIGVGPATIRYVEGGAPAPAPAGPDRTQVL
jgi:pSer/pThr/pTyr-binding forkhead associated (FHA) protein